MCVSYLLNPIYPTPPPPPPPSSLPESDCKRDGARPGTSIQSPLQTVRHIPDVDRSRTQDGGRVKELRDFGIELLFPAFFQSNLVLDSVYFNLFLPVIHHS